MINKEDYNKVEDIFNINGGITIEQIQKALNISDSNARIYRALLTKSDELKSIFGDIDITETNSKLAKKAQKYMDMNRIERKVFRENTRFENTIEVMNEALIENFDKVDFNIEYNPVDIKVSGNKAIIQLTDTHFNELIDLDINRYDFKIAGKRLQKYAFEIKQRLKVLNVKKVVLAMTGDMMNSDRRLDEKMTMSTNRMSAAMIASNLIQYFIQDLMKEFDEMDIFYVTGNESRSYEMGWTNIIATDNYDSLIFNILKLLFKKKDNIKFHDTNPVETVVSLNGINVLLTHGTTFGMQPAGAINKVYSKFAAKGINLSYSLFGHIHNTMITDNFGRSGSLCGANTYSDLALNFNGSASQNLTVIKKDGSIDAYRIDLQNTDKFKGYKINNDLNLYNAKSADKVHKSYIVVEVNK